MQETLCLLPSIQVFFFVAHLRTVLVMILSESNQIIFDVAQKLMKALSGSKVIQSLI